MALETRYTETTTITTRSRVDDGAGGYKWSDGTTVANYRCSIFPASAFERTALIEQFELRSNAGVFRVVGGVATIVPKDTLTVTAGNFSGSEFQILSVNPQPGADGTAHHLAMLGLKIK